MNNIEQVKKRTKRDVIDHMKGLGIYKEHYDPTIDVYVDMLIQYDEFTRQFEEGGCKVQEEYTNKAGATNMRKTPIWGALEKLRMDLATYSNMLCLNPKSLESITQEVEGKSKLAMILDEFDES